MKIMGYSSENSFYTSPKFRNIRAYKLELTPLCERCVKNNLLVTATDVHHILEVRDYPLLALTLSNLESLCHSCHSRHTGISRRPNDVKVYNAKWKL